MKLVNKKSKLKDFFWKSLTFTGISLSGLSLVSCSSIKNPNSSSELQTVFASQAIERKIITPSSSIPRKITPSSSVPNIKKESNIVNPSDANFWNEILNPRKSASYSLPSDFVDNLDAMMNVMNSQMNNTLLFSQSIQKMTPEDLGMYLVDFYNETAGGQYDFAINFQESSDRFAVNVKSPLENIISSFNNNGKDPINENTHINFQNSLLETVVNLVSKVGLGDWKNFFNIFENYTSDIFNMNNLQLISLVLTNNPKNDVENRAAYILRLLDTLPKETIQLFPNLLDNYKLLANKFANTNTTKEWADHYKIDLTGIDHFMIHTLMFSGNS